MKEKNDPADEDMKRLDDALKVLGEFFDTAAIFCTRNVGEEEGNTVYVHKGTGNWYARYGQVKHWCLRAEEQTKADARDDHEKEDE